MYKKYLSINVTKAMMECHISMKMSYQLTYRHKYHQVDL